MKLHMIVSVLLLKQDYISAIELIVKCVQIGSDHFNDTSFPSVKHQLLSAFSAHLCVFHVQECHLSKWKCYTLPKRLPRILEFSQKSPVLKGLYQVQIQMPKSIGCRGPIKIISESVQSCRQRLHSPDSFKTHYVCEIPQSCNPSECLSISKEKGQVI